MPWRPKLAPGDRVRWYMPGGDWGNGDTGTVTACDTNGSINVRWDHGPGGHISAAGVRWLHRIKDGEQE